MKSLNPYSEFDLLPIEAKSGIHIKPSKKGTFTKAAKAHGKSVQGFASQVLSNKENYSPAMVKKANFAHVFGGRNYGLGGYIEGKEYDVDEKEIERLRKMGYEFEILY